MVVRVGAMLEQQQQYLVRVGVGVRVRVRVRVRVGVRSRVSAVLEQQQQDLALAVPSGAGERGAAVEPVALHVALCAALEEHADRLRAKLGLLRGRHHMVRVDGGDNQLAFTKGCKVTK